MRAYAIVICLIIGEQMANMPLPQRHDMVEALASDRSDQPFNMTVLPRRTWRDRPISDAHDSQPACDRATIGGVTIADEVARRLVPRECFGDLSGDPFGGRMCGHVDPDETSPLQTQDHQPVEKFEPNGRNDEQINGGDVRSVNAQERSPTCRGGPRRRHMYLATVDWEMSIPSFSNSP